MHTRNSRNEQFLDDIILQNGALTRPSPSPSPSPPPSTWPAAGRTPCVPLPSVLGAGAAKGSHRRLEHWAWCGGGKEKKLYLYSCAYIDKQIHAQTWSVLTFSNMINITCNKLEHALSKKHVAYLSVITRCGQTKSMICSYCSSNLKPRVCCQFW